MKKLSLLLVLVMMLSTFLMACSEGAGGTSEESDVIKFGVFEPLTGANAAGGAMELEGLEVAQELYPEVLGKKLNW